VEDHEKGRGNGPRWNGAFGATLRILLGILLTGGVTSVIFYAGAYWNSTRETPTAIEANRKTLNEMNQEIAVIKALRDGKDISYERRFNQLEKSIDKLEQSLKELRKEENERLHFEKRQ
jgi:sensor histidine kinase YesM